MKCSNIIDGSVCSISGRRCAAFSNGGAGFAPLCTSFLPDDIDSIPHTAGMSKQAAWDDVRAKGKAIAEMGGVEIYRNDAQEVGAYVMSGVVEGLFPVYDGGPYEVILSKKSWENEKNVGGWVKAYICSCKWGSYHSGSPGQGGRWGGRFCAHAYSTLLVANARARGDFMNDRTASVDEGWHITEYDGQRVHMREYANGCVGIIYKRKYWDLIDSVGNYVGAGREPNLGECKATCDYEASRRTAKKIISGVEFSLFDAKESAMGQSRYWEDEYSSFGQYSNRNYWCGWFGYVEQDGDVFSWELEDAARRIKDSGVSMSFDDAKRDCDAAMERSLDMNHFGSVSDGWSRDGDGYFKEFGDHVGYAYADGTWMLIAPDGSIANGSVADGSFDAAMEDCEHAARQMRLAEVNLASRKASPMYNFPLISQVVERILDIKGNQFKNWQSLWELQEDEDVVNLFNQFRDMTDDDYAEACRRAWEEISMTASRKNAGGEWEFLPDKAVRQYDGEWVGWAFDDGRWEVFSNEGVPGDEGVAGDLYEAMHECDMAASDFGADVGGIAVVLSRKSASDGWEYYGENVTPELRHDILDPDEILDMYGAYTDESYRKVENGMLGVVSHHVGMVDDWWTWDTYAGYYSYGIDCGTCGSKDEAIAMCERSFADPGFTVGGKMASSGDWRKVLDQPNCELWSNQFDKWYAGDAYGDGSWYLYDGTGQEVDSGEEQDIDAAKAACEESYFVNCDPYFSAGRMAKHAWRDMGDGTWYEDYELGMSGIIVEENGGYSWGAYDGDTEVGSGWVDDIDKAFSEVDAALARYIDNMPLGFDQYGVPFGTPFEEYMLDNGYPLMARRAYTNPWGTESADRIEVYNELVGSMSISADDNGESPTFDDDEQWAFPYMRVDYDVSARYGDWSVLCKMGVIVEEGVPFDTSDGVFEMVLSSPDGSDTYLYNDEYKGALSDMRANGEGGGYDYYISVKPGAFGNEFIADFMDDGRFDFLMEAAQVISDRINYASIMNVASRTADKEWKPIFEVGDTFSAGGYMFEVYATQSGYETGYMDDFCPPSWYASTRLENGKYLHLADGGFAARIWAVSDSPIWGDGMCLEAGSRDNGPSVESFEFTDGHGWPTAWSGFLGSVTLDDIVADFESRSMYARNFVASSVKTVRMEDVSASRKANVTQNGLYYDVAFEIDPMWVGYDSTVAEGQLATYGKIFVDEYGSPIDDEYAADEAADDYDMLMRASRKTAEIVDLNNGMCADIEFDGNVWQWKLFFNSNIGNSVVHGSAPYYNDAYLAAGEASMKFAVKVANTHCIVYEVAGGNVNMDSVPVEDAVYTSVQAYDGWYVAKIDDDWGFREFGPYPTYAKAVSFCDENGYAIVTAGKVAYNYASFDADSKWRCHEEGFEGEYGLDELKELYESVVDKSEYPEFEDWEWDATRSGWLYRVGALDGYCSEECKDKQLAPYTSGKNASCKVATRQFTYAEIQELEDEIEGTELHNADRLKDGGVEYYGEI